MTWSRQTLMRRLAAALVALALCAAAAGAQEPADEKSAPSGIPLLVMVTRLSNEGLGVDPRAKELEGKLSSQGIRYDSVQVLEERRLALQLDEIGTIDLPNGRKAHMRPLHRNDEGVLLAVDVEGASKADVRAKPHHTVIFSAGTYQEGKLVLSIEPGE